MKQFMAGSIIIASFPENSDESKGWEPKIQIRALASTVLVVATTRIEGTWKAYCDSVPGRSHKHEYQAVLDHGNAVPERVAVAMFPQFASIPYAR